MKDGEIKETFHRNKSDVSYTFSPVSTVDLTWNNTSSPPGGYHTNCRHSVERRKSHACQT